MLGSSRSGKSAVLKSMHFFCDMTYSRAERVSFKRIVLTNIVKFMQDVLGVMEERELRLEHHENNIYIEVILTQSTTLEDPVLPPDVLSAITAL